MSILTKLRYTPKHFAVIAAVIAAGAATALSFAWGPSRATFTIEKPATYVTFNSITNNPIDGDERNFARVIETSDPVGDVTVEPGKEYTVRMYYHNNATDNLNLKATGTKAIAAVPTTTGKTVSLTGYIYADNANPKQVWDDVTFKSDQDFNLAYVPGSARIYNNGFASNTDGQPLSDSLVTSAGAMLGYAKSGDGIIPGCFKYSGYVTFKVKPQFAATATYTMDKQVRKHSATTGGWGETYAAQPGEVVDFIVRYDNTGQTTMKDVVVKDTLPAGLTYVAGSTVLANGNYPNGTTAPDGVTTSGINIGTYAPGLNAWVRFSAKVADNANLPTCGANTLRNVATVETSYGSKSDDASVTTTKTCEAPKPVYTCDGMTIDKISRTEFKFSVNKTVQNATYVKTVFVVRNANGTEVARVDDVDGILNYTQTAVGKYTVEATIVVKVDGVDKTASSDNCKKPFEVEAVPAGKVEVCDPETRNIIQVPETDKDKYLPVDSPKCEKIEVCIKDSGDTTLKPIYKDEFDASKHSTNPNDCKKPETPAPEEPTPPKPEPETPAIIPATGPEIIGGLAGTSALSYGAYTYLASRRAIRNVRK